MLCQGAGREGRNGEGVRRVRDSEAAGSRG